MASRESHQQRSLIAAKANGRLTPGQIPPIGVENEERARENLRIKLSVVQAWIKQTLEPDSTVPNEILIPVATLPRSQRAFNAWTSTDMPKHVVNLYGQFHKNANSTLLKNCTILQDLRDYLKILKQAEKTSSAQKKQQTVSSLHRRLGIEKILRGIAEKELVRARAQVWRKRDELESLKAELVSTQAYATEMITKLEALLAQATAERAELARTLNKVVSMRPVTK